MTEAVRRLRIAQVAPPVERVPPAAYGGTERVVHELTNQLVDRGHDVTVFASGDSQVAGKLVPTVERALRPAGIEGDASGWFATTVKMVVEQASGFDVVHSHLEWWSIPLARLSPVPVVATFHGRLDLPWADRLFRDAPDGMVAISRHQASTHPDVPWTIIHNGLTLDRAPFREQPGDAFCFVGRVDAEKGIIEAIDIALRAGRRLRIAAKVGNLPRQRDYYENVFRPALQRAGRSVEYLGEVQPAERDQLFAESYATLMPGAWPEPFGLVSIESLACGTPVLARRVGALPEIIREGVDGFFGDDAAAMAFFADRLGALDRREIRERVIERFSAARMADRYEELYARMVEAAEASPAPPERVADADEVAEALAAELPTEVTEPEDVEQPGLPPAVPVAAAADVLSDETAVEATEAAEAPRADEPSAVAPSEAVAAEQPAVAAEEAEQGATIPDALIEYPPSDEPAAVAPEAVAPEAVAPEAVAPEAVAPEAVAPEAAIEAAPPEAVAPGAAPMTATEAAPLEALAPEAVIEAASPEAVAPGAAPMTATEAAPPEALAPEAAIEAAPPEAVAPEAAIEAAPPEAVAIVAAPPEAVAPEAVAPEAAIEAAPPEAIAPEAAPMAATEAAPLEALAPEAVIEAAPPEAVAPEAAIVAAPPEALAPEAALEEAPPEAIATEAPGDEQTGELPQQVAAPHEPPLEDVVPPEEVAALDGAPIRVAAVADEAPGGQALEDVSSIEVAIFEVETIEAAPIVAESPLDEPPQDVVPEEAPREAALAEATPTNQVLADAAPPEEAAPAAEPVAADIAPPAASTLEKSPVAVGPGMNTVQPRAIVPPTPPKPKPASKPAPKRQISVFTRLWSGSSGKAAGGRRRDRS